MSFEIEIDDSGEKYLIDRERDAAFRINDGRPRARGAPEFFDLHWHKNTIPIGAYFESIELPHKDFGLNWHVVEVAIPQELRPHEPEIRALITEALQVYKFNFNDTYKINAVLFDSNYESPLL